MLIRAGLLEGTGNPAFRIEMHCGDLIVEPELLKSILLTDENGKFAATSSWRHNCVKAFVSPPDSLSKSKTCIQPEIISETPEQHNSDQIEIDVTRRGNRLRAVSQKPSETKSEVYDSLLSHSAKIVIGKTNQQCPICLEHLVIGTHRITKVKFVED